MAERKTRESRWTYGWPSILAVASLVVAVGFAVGVIAGITWEAPGLVVGYLGGQTEAIDWSVEATDEPAIGEIAADGAIPQTPDVAAAPPLGQRNPKQNAAAEPDRATGAVLGSDRAPAAAARDAVRAPEPEPAAALRPEAGSFAVQVGAFSEKSAAQALADSLRGHGYPVYLSPSEGKPASWRVRVGPMRTRPEAEKTARRLESAQKLPTWVLGEDS